MLSNAFRSCRVVMERSSHEVSRVKGLIVYSRASWNLTNLPFALAHKPHTKLVLSSGDAHSPLRASAGQDLNVGLFPSEIHDCFSENLVVRPHSNGSLLVPPGTAALGSPCGTVKREGGWGVWGAGTGASGSRPPGRRPSSGRLSQPAHIEIRSTPQQLIGDHQQASGQRHRSGLLASS
jgi:hypothetical protein